MRQRLTGSYDDDYSRLIARYILEFVTADKARELFGCASLLFYSFDVMLQKKATYGHCSVAVPHESWPELHPRLEPVHHGIARHNIRNLFILCLLFRIFLLCVLHRENARARDHVFFRPHFS